jgi:uncharacterized protein
LGSAQGDAEDNPGHKDGRAKVFWFSFSKKNTSFFGNGRLMQSETSSTPHASPVSLAERIAFIDVLRGMALFGILAANMRAFVAPMDAYFNIDALYPDRADVIAQFCVDWLFQGKFVSIFSFLFGLGFAMQMSRAEARGVSFLGFYPRRLAALALLGLIHGFLIWAGDILLTYALSGALLLLFRHRRQKTLLYWAGCLIGFPIVALWAVLALYLSPSRPKWMVPKPPPLAKWHEVIQIYAHGSLKQILMQNLVEGRDALLSNLFAFYALALFLLGMWVWRSGIVTRLDAYRPVLRRVCFWGLAVGLPLSLYHAAVSALIPIGHFSVWLFLGQIVWLPSAHAQAAGYMAGLALLYLDAGWRRALMPFAAVGRMALTNYLAQSVLCTLFFYHTGTGWFGSVGPALAWVPTIVLYAAQLVFSNVWLRHYRFGPMEYVWRAMTYGTLPPMRLSAAA